MEKWLKFVLRFPKQIILFIIIISFFFLLQVPDIKIDTEIENNLPPDLPELIFLKEIEEKFPLSTDIALLCLVMPEGESIFSRDVLERVDRLSQGCAEIKGVAEVLSITTYEEIKGGALGFQVQPIYRSDELDPKGIARFRDRVMGVEILRANLMGSDDQATGIMLIIDQQSIEDKEVFVEELEQLAATVGGSGDIYIGGGDITNIKLTSLILADIFILVPFVIIFLLVVLYLSFGTMWSVLLPLLTVFLSVIWTVGFMSIFDIPISFSTMAVPILLSAVGTAYGIHILNRYSEDIQGANNPTHHIIDSTSQVGMAVFLSGFTTIAGFLSLNTSRIPPVRTFGFVTALGVCLALFFSLTIIPAVLSLLRDRKVPVKQPALNLLIGRFLNMVGNIMNTKRWIVTVSMAVLIFLALMGLPQISTEVNPVGTLPSDNILRQTYDVINRYFIGTSSLRLVITGEPGDFLRIENLEAIHTLEERLKEDENVGMVQSVNMYIKQVNQSLYGGGQEYYRLPANTEEVEDCYFFLELGGLDEEVERFVAPDYGETNVSIFLRTGDTGIINSYVKTIEEWALELFSPELEVNITGLGYLYLSVHNLLIQSQIWSLVLSLFLVFLIVSILLRSIIKGLFSLLALGTAVIINFGIMGWLKIPLDVATVTISSIAVGIGVDYSIHFLSRLGKELKYSKMEQAITKTISTAGKAISFNALAVMCGFLVLLFSSFQSLKFTGLLVGVTMLSTSIGSLTVLPLAIIFFKPSFAQKEGKVKCLLMKSK